MTGRTLVGLRAEDIVAALDVLESRGLAPAQGVAGFGKGNAAVDLLHAAAFDRRIGSLALEEMPVSWAAVATAPLHRRAFDIIVPGALGQYDLPDLAAALAPRPVSIVNARSAAGPILRTEKSKERVRPRGACAHRIAPRERYRFRRLPRVPRAVATESIPGCRNRPGPRPLSGASS